MILIICTCIPPLPCGIETIYLRKIRCFSIVVLIQIQSTSPHCVEVNGVVKNSCLKGKFAFLIVKNPKHSNTRIRNTFSNKGFSIIKFIIPCQLCNQFLKTFFLRIIWLSNVVPKFKFCIYNYLFWFFL